MSYNLKFSILVITCSLVLPFIGLSQEISGIVKTKISYISFENFGLNELDFNGTIKENFLGTKYKVNLQSEEEDLTGEIYDQLSRFEIDLHYGDQNITGHVKRSTNRTNDKWDIDFMGQKLTGTIRYNYMETKATYELSLGDDQLTGTVRKNFNTREYDLQYGVSSISGTMTLNLTSVKHTYSLKSEELSNKEFLVFFFVEFMQLINYEIWDTEDFQDDQNGVFDDE